MIETLFPTFLLTLISSHKPHNYMLFQWWVLLALCLIFLSYKLKEKYGFWIASAIGYTLFQCCAFTLFDYYHDAPPQIHDVLLVTNLYGMVSFLIPILAVVALKDCHVINILKALPLYGLLNSIYVIYGSITGATKFANGVGYSGFLDYAGMNGVLIALSVPLVFIYSMRTRLILLAFYITAIILSKSSIPYGVAAVGLLGFFFHRAKGDPKLRSGMYLALVPVVVSGIVERELLFNSAGRFEMYKIFMQGWWERGHHILGTGVGTFQVIEAQIIQQHNLLRPGSGVFLWLWMHSDWLQCIFELGFLGIFLYLASFIYTTYVSYNRGGRLASESFGLLMAIAASAVFDYPCRYAVTAFLICLAVRAAFVSEDNLAA